MFTPLTRGVWPVNRHYPTSQVLERLHVAAVGLLCFCLSTEPQLANESQAPAARGTPAHNLWSVPRTTALDMPTILEITVETSALGPDGGVAGTSGDD